MKKLIERLQIEVEKGRLPFWLEKDEIEFLANEWRKIPTNADEKTRQFWSQIAFKAMSSLHQSNIDYESKFPSEDEKYLLKETQFLI